jgi:hypothetical protein
MIKMLIIGTPMDIDRLASQINAVSNLKAGTLWFWGESFGRPGDNYHSVVGCRAEGNAIVLNFDAGETLTICNPEGVQFSQGEFSIADASAVRWEWCYDEPSDNSPHRYFDEFIREGDRIFGSTNRKSGWLSRLITPSPTVKAIEIL